MGRKRILGAIVPLFGLTFLGSCFVSEREVAVPPPPPPAPAATTIIVNPPAQRVLTYSEGRYELRGDGRTVPYYWVWIPAGAAREVAPSSPPPVVVVSPPVQRTIPYPGGRYELRGDGTTMPYYWVWIPAGASPPWPPPPAS